MFTIRQYVFLYAALLGSMFAGSSVVHAVLQPDLTLPAVAPPRVASAAASAAASAGDTPRAALAAAPPPRQLV